MWDIKWNQKQIDRWAKTRQMRKWDYARTRGLQWGLLMALANSFHNPFIIRPSRTNRDIALYSIGYVMIYCVAGLLYGLVEWCDNERTYHKALEGQPDAITMRKYILLGLGFVAFLGIVLFFPKNN